LIPKTFGKQNWTDKIRFAGESATALSRNVRLQTSVQEKLNRRMPAGASRPKYKRVFAGEPEGGAFSKSIPSVTFPVYEVKTMTYSYYPGCTLRTKAKELDQKGRAAAAALGITLEELPEWQCCGGVYTTAKDEIATKLSSVRALAAARERGGVLVTLCSACHNVLKQVNRDMAEDEDFRNKANLYLKLDTPYAGETKVVHYLELLRDVVGFDKLAEAVKNPAEKKIGAYYGCLLLRPGKVMAMDDPENPRIMEDFIRAIGGEPVVYGMRNECCGGYMAMEDTASAVKKSTSVMKNAEGAGAEALITACPLCLYNLTKNAESDVPVYYFTELLADALGV